MRGLPLHANWWNYFYSVCFGLKTRFRPMETKGNNGDLILRFPPVSRQKVFFSRMSENLSDFRIEPFGLPEKEEWKIILSPHTIEPNFPDGIITTDRPKTGYALAIEDSQEVPEETLYRSPADLKKEFEKAERTGLTFFEYLALHLLKPRLDQFYINLLLNSELSDGRVVCAEKSVWHKLINVFAWPKDYKEHNSQGGRSAMIILPD